MAFGRQPRRRVTFDESFARGGEGVPETTRRDLNFFISRVVAAGWYSIVGEPVPPVDSGSDLDDPLYPDETDETDETDLPEASPLEGTRFDPTLYGRAALYGEDDDDILRP
jgi:hypothetical protein